ncbi:hypothetical protein ScPMuIL_018633 [Solemya velum]
MSDNRKKRYTGGGQRRAENGEPSPRQHPAPHPQRSRNNNSQTSGYQYNRMNSSDKVRKIVQQEGRTARNLVLYSVPVEHQTGRQGYRQRGKLPLKDYKNVSPSKSRSQSAEFCPSSKDQTRSPKSDAKKPDLRARYWKFLFDNLQRAVDAIYETCEQDESVVECKEVIMMLERSTRDFQSLIERLHVLKAYDDAAKDGDRPTSIAWEVRKMSPGKSPSQGQGHCSPSPAQRVLTFSTPNQTLTEKKTPGSGNSWADKVKGVVAKIETPPLTPPSRLHSTPESDITLSPPIVLAPPPPPRNRQPSTASEDSDGEGWETVHRGGKTKARNSPSQRSLENLSLSSEKRTNRSLTRSKSDPYTPVPKHNTKFPKRENNRSTNRKNALNSRKSTLTPIRDRSTRKDSEKENRPLTYSKVVNKGGPPVPTSDMSSTDQGSTESMSSRSDTHKPDTKSPCLDQIAQTLDAKESLKAVTCSEAEQLMLNGVEDPIDLVDLDISVGVNDTSVFETTDTSMPKDGEDLKAHSTPDVGDLLEESVHDEEEALSAKSEQLDDALASVQDEEDSLRKQLEEEQEQALKSAIQEEESWLKELAREESLQIEVETETESDLAVSGSSNLEASSSFDGTQGLDWDDMVAQYDEAKAAGANKSWGEMVEEAEARTPGHAVHMHAKLSSPSRRRSPTLSKRRHEEKQAKAQELREKLMQEKAERLRDLSKKVEEVRSWKEELLRQRKETIEKKMQMAEEKRQVQLRMKAQKAHDEEAKANEIAFINSLEAQNKRHDILSKHQDSEARLQEIQEGRQRRMEEKLAKEAAVEERKKALEAERAAWLTEIQQRRKEKDAKIEQQQQEKEKERIVAVRAKEKDREERIAALNAQHEANKKELQKKIQQKQSESTQRHKEALQQIREKAFEMSVLRHSTEDHNDAPLRTPYDTQKLCTICNVLITSEVYLLSHLRGKKHQQALRDNNSGKAMTKGEIETFNLKHIVDAPDNNTHPKIVSEKERQKAMRKRCKKLRQRMITRGLEYDTTLLYKQKIVESEHKAKMQKLVKDINKYLQTPESGPWSPNKVNALDRALGEIGRILDKKGSADQVSFLALGGLTSMTRILQVIDIINSDSPQILPNKSLVLTCNVFRQACKGCYDNCHYMLFSNKIGTLVDVLQYRLSLIVPDEIKKVESSISASDLPHDPVATVLMQLIACILSCLAKNNPLLNCSEASVERMSGSGDAFVNRGNDVISYVISSGVVDKLTQYFQNVLGSINDSRDTADILQHGLGLLGAMTKFLSKRNISIFDKRKAEDPTQLIMTLEVTELVGIVSLLYGMLLHSNVQSRSDTTAPPELPQHTILVTTTGLRMLNHMATLDLSMLQKTLGDEGTSLEFRHISSYLIWYCSHHPAEELLHEVILCVGYFTILHPDNQVVIQSGQPPTVLQQLCSLPFQYFSDPHLTAVLFPTLISCCYNNKANQDILEQELSCMLLANFIEEKQLEMQQNKLMPSSAKKDNKEKAKDSDTRMLLMTRFPQEQWAAAKGYFEAPA